MSATATPSPDHSLLASSVLRRIRRELAEEARAAAERVAAVLPRLGAEVAALRAEGAAREVWLFGSYADGDPAASSDVDLLVDGDVDRVAERLEASLGLRVDVHALRDSPASLVERARRFGRRL
jgi:predicted nucleotidyltransferase